MPKVREVDECAIVLLTGLARAYQRDAGQVTQRLQELGVMIEAREKHPELAADGLALAIGIVIDELAGIGDRNA
ncbi:hypothetical protein ACFYWS_20655 [Streptomyces sp. NPDC002795]|uniref:hypothetical protein n=1 Tax=Streptomyces sp. NPDC002795 TaxID=3364665 RepID=UPI0036C5E58C